MDSREQLIVDAVDTMRDEILGFLFRLVRQDSTLGREAGAVRVVEEEFVRLGFLPVKVPIDKTRLVSHPGFAPVPWEYDKDGRHNVAATIQGTDQGRSTLFNGHVDVVSPEPLDYWETDPFLPIRKDGWIHGRGAGDMKAGVAAMIYAAKAVERAGFALKGDVTMEAVIEEECCGNGALACLDAGYDADAVLIPEPFGPTILTSQVGVLWFKIEINGEPRHVLEAGVGTNAIEKMFPIIQGLRELEEEMNAEERPDAYRDVVHPLNMNVGVVKGGDWPSTVPAFAELHGRMSFFPGVECETVQDRISRTVKQCAEKDPWLRENKPWVSFYGFRSNGHTLPLDLEPFGVLNGCHKALTGQDAQEYIATCTTDLRAFTSYGKGQATCFGPVAENIHAANERVHFESIMHTARAYALFLARWSGLDD